MASIVHQMQTPAVARGSGESVYQDLTGGSACCILHHHFDQRFVAVLRGVVRFSRDCCLNTSPCIQLGIALLQHMYISIWQCDNHRLRSGWPPLARGLFMGLPRSCCRLRRRRRRVCHPRKRPITNGLGVAVLSCLCSFVQNTQERRLCEPMSRRLATLTHFSA